MPTDAVRPPVAVRMRRRSACARALTPSTVRSAPADRREVDVRLVDRHLLDQGRHLLQQRHHHP